LNIFKYFQAIFVPILETALFSNLEQLAGIGNTSTSQIIIAGGSRSLKFAGRTKSPTYWDHAKQI
jgi:hypothetical protein